VSASHPIVRTHPETGRNALYLGRRRDARIEGLEADASDRLLDALWAHTTRDGASWHHSWRVGDTIVWDNRCAIHHRNSFDGGLRRVMHRTQTTGTVPVRLPDGAMGHPRAALAATALPR
jgi:taurine dioxygenase